jgi:hypothetical protein
MQSTITQTRIHGYLVELEIDPEVEWTDCWIMQNGYSASLACLEVQGVLSNSSWDEIEVSPHTIEAISKWAEKNGY